MAAISAETYKKVKTALQNCPALQEDDDRWLLNHPKLREWLGSDRPSDRRGRVNRLMALLTNRTNEYGENGLALLLAILLAEEGESGAYGETLRDAAESLADELGVDMPDLFAEMAMANGGSHGGAKGIDFGDVDDLPRSVEEEGEEEPLAQDRRLEAAMPAQLIVQQTTELLVMVPLKDGKGLRAFLPLETDNGEIIDEGDVAGVGATITFSDKEQSTLVYLNVRVSERDFEIDEPMRAFRVFPDRDGDYESFFLTPLRATKRAPVTVKMYADQAQTESLGTVRLNVAIVAEQDGTTTWVSAIKREFAHVNSAITINIVEGDQISVDDISGDGVVVGSGSAEINEGDDIEMSGDFRGAILNVKSTLSDVQQTIEKIQGLDDAGKAELQTLISQLEAALVKLPEEHDQNVEAISQTAQTLIETASEENPNKSLLEISGEGLKQAAQNLADITPNVVKIATSIVGLLIGLG